MSFDMRALRLCWLLGGKARVVTAVIVGGSGAHFLRSAQVNAEMKGIRSARNMQRARRVRIRAVLAMHMPDSGIHALCRIPCAPIHPPFSSQVTRESACSCSCCRSVKTGLPKALRLVLRCAVPHSLSSFCREQSKKSVHDTQGIHRLGLFIIHRRVVQTLRVVLRSCYLLHSHDVW